MLLGPCPISAAPRPTPPLTSTLTIHVGCVWLAPSPVPMGPSSSVPHGGLVSSYRLSPLPPAGISPPTEEGQGTKSELSFPSLYHSGAHLDTSGLLLVPKTFSA